MADDKSIIIECNENPLYGYHKEKDRTKWNDDKKK